MAQKAAWWAAKRKAWCRELGDGSVDRGHFKLTLNEWRVARAMDPDWQVGADAGAGDRAGINQS